MADAPRLLDRLDADDAEHFAAVRELLDDAGVRYELDPTLVRGLDYYTRTVFEFTSDALGAQSGVGGGGRYDGLIELLGGPPTPGIGWAAGRRADAAGGRASRRSPPPLVDLFVALADRPTPRGRRSQLVLEARARRARARRSSSPAARSRASSSTPTGSARATSRSSARRHGAALKEMESGEQRELELARRDPDDPARQPARVKHAAAAERATATTGAATCARPTPARRRASPAGCTAAATTAA